MDTSDPAPQRPRIQELSSAVLAGGDPEDLLELLTARARADLGAEAAALVLPDPDGAWSVEIVDGAGREELLGLGVSPESALGRAMAGGDLDAIAGADVTDLPLPGGRALVAPVVLDSGLGALLAGLPADRDDRATASSDAASAARERLDALAALTAQALAAPVDAEDATGVDDERRRIAQDLHDLAIQELFAVGMELESMHRALVDPAVRETVDPRFARSTETSVQGVERAVAQIRQIVQSLRRDRPQATLSERLRHEAGLATAGLGFAPSLRLPTDPARFDAEVPEEIAEDVVAVVRECLANAARHAHASAVAISVTLFSEGVDRVTQVDVSDNGCGIDPTVRRRSGLANMASRARRHQGWVDAIPLEPGTMISWRVTLPVE